MMTSNSQDARELAQAAWMEHQILDHVKKALRVTLGWNAPAVSMSRKMSSVQFTVKSFQRHLLRMMDLEEQDGYMSVVMERNPNCAARIERLECDHQGIRQAIESLEPEIAALTALDPPQFNAVCGRIVELLDCVDAHDAKEVELLQETMLCDDGGEG